MLFQTPEFDEEGWPLSIPMPGPLDFCELAYQKGRTCCLSGWRRVAFGIFDGNRVRRTRREPPQMHPAERTFYETLVRFCGDHDLGRWNDNHTPEERATLWKKAAKHHKYTVMYNAK